VTDLYKTTDDYRMARSAQRLRTFLRDAPNIDTLIESECNLMVRAVVRRYGTELVRQWLDGIVDEYADDLLREPI